jgi:leucyl aminopeptidase (aminopeptidase T)
MNLADREGVTISPLGPGFFTLPYYAEAAVAPVEGTAEGIIVADLTMRGWGYLLRDPLRYAVKAGKVVEVFGSTEDADRLRKICGADEHAANIAELGIGTSHIIPKALLGTNRDFGRMGTAHIGIGRNNDIGGKTWSRIHLDGLMSHATIELDNHCVLRGGSFLI